MSERERASQNQQRYGSLSLSENAVRQIDQERADLAQRQERARAEKRRLLERDVRERFLSSGGSEDEWSRQRETLVAARLGELALKGDDVARLSNQRRYCGV
jgi:hypothetical protein